MLDRAPARFNFLHLNSIARRRARVWPASWRSTSREEKDETGSNAIEPGAILRRDGACDLRCASPRYRLRSSDRAERGNRLDGYLHRYERSENQAAGRWRQATASSPRLSPRALSSCGTRFSPLIMHLRVHLSWIIIVAPPSDIAIGHVPGAGVSGNGTAAIGIIEAVVAQFFPVASRVWPCFLI